MAKKVKTERKVESVMKPYELMLILSPDLRESDVKKKLKEITDMIEKAGGKVTHEDFWGKRELAYRIKKCDKGIYIVYNLELPNTFLAEFKQHLRIEKDVLRTMILSLPEGHTYTKYDLEVPKEERLKKEKPKKAVKPKEKIEVAPVKEEIEEKIEEKTEEVEEKTEEPKEKIKKEEGKEKEPKKVWEKEEKMEEPKEKKEKVEEKAEEPEEVEEKEEEEKELTPEELEEKRRESELDRKLDELLGGEDLKL